MQLELAGQLRQRLVALHRRQGHLGPKGAPKHATLPYHRLDLLRQRPPFSRAKFLHLIRWSSFWGPLQITGLGACKAWSTHGAPWTRRRGNLTTILPAT